MATHGILAWLVIGAVAGWLAGLLVKGGGFGLLVDIVVGIVGAFVGGWLSGALGISFGGGLLASIITATLGAVALLFVLRLFRRA
ncbi:GlsB/YeaQ/YmgE family stress response membrane protein [Dyella sp. BiH032]|uniref:GlsB/YeaQ/YmgE family stress response membrane protein n=1 Tax=Dyella sp. BiH032 TaxID=3075430 RepID=UPI0028937850|nr:GlsB/YeaQ/YmgE family stress response membrane protein [Dyella sp. BiH032]WNL44727.1 GlsB/YeaQ/YmgE family stress response membrane protein [Dyella sp. BiH032]